jgi:hypothetical protein
MSKTCYICGKEATSKEHTPARCYFPEESQYRKNLITVPSCEEHNENTSNDDEYVRNIISMSIGNNAVAFMQFIKKTVVSFEKSRGIFIDTTKNAQRIYTAIEGEKPKPSYAFKIDRNRFDDVMKKISYALFYSVYKEPWDKELIIMTKHLLDKDMILDEYGDLIESIEDELEEHPFDGKNPQVFKYKFLPTESDNKHEQVLRMVFYEGFEIWVTTRNDIRSA